MLKVPQCMVCKHFYFLPGLPCDAFPDGAPREIFDDKVRHDHPIEGDHGIQFEPITREELIAVLTQRRAEGIDYDALVEEKYRRDWERARQEGRVTGEYQPQQRT